MNHKLKSIFLGIIKTVFGGMSTLPIFFIHKAEAIDFGEQPLPITPPPGVATTDYITLTLNITNLASFTFCIILFIMIIIRGQQWLTNRGDKEKAKKAKKKFQFWVIGLAVIFILWFFAKWIIQIWADSTDTFIG